MDEGAVFDGRGLSAGDYVGIFDAQGRETILSMMTNSLIGEYHETKSNTQG
ncbi:MAG: hypothetical protein U9N07_02970 [Euryarchaeota archaeon]|nr:hypothetical protein [Euryarchaeota archaeon]